jgi:hypothetical protein
MHGPLGFAGRGRFLPSELIVMAQHGGPKIRRNPGWRVPSVSNDRLRQTDKRRRQAGFLLIILNILIVFLGVIIDLAGLREEPLALVCP